MSDSILLVNDPFGPAGPGGGGAFAGLPPATLQQILANAQVALSEMIAGGRAVTISYGEGSGQKSVTYQRGSEASLRQHIAELKLLLGTGRPRRPIRFGF